ncbi:MAG: hypothetical protein K2N51_12215 [Lachnospiraceae bacterium]|nr:hypothetical protein [Lachnospiraceae bacterium]
MNRKQAIKIIASDKIENLSIEDRELIIYNAWGLDKTDEEFHLLPPNLKKELLNFDEPQHDVVSSEYDELVKISCESSYDEYSNEQLAVMASSILRKRVFVDGENPKMYPCPCCGKETLSIRGEYDICSNCNWEDDGNEDEDMYSSANHMTLKQGKKNYLLYGRVE